LFRVSVRAGKCREGFGTCAIVSRIIKIKGWIRCRFECAGRFGGAEVTATQAPFRRASASRVAFVLGQARVVEPQPESVSPLGAFRRAPRQFACPARAIRRLDPAGIIWRVFGEFFEELAELGARAFGLCRVHLALLAPTRLVDADFGFEHLLLDTISLLGASGWIGKSALREKFDLPAGGRFFRGGVSGRARAA